MGDLVVPETELGVLPEDLVGLDTIEWAVEPPTYQRGSRAALRGQSGSTTQLNNYGQHEPSSASSGWSSLWHGNAEAVPAADESFDLAISEYGASIWCDPYRWIPEAARLLRPGGQLIFLVRGVIAALTFPDDPDAPAGDRLLRPYFGMHRFEWNGEDSVDFQLPHGEMIALLGRCGFVVEDLIEVRPPEGSTTEFPLVTLEWAQQWPCEEIWKTRKQR